jgi:cytochrome c556
MRRFFQGIGILTVSFVAAGLIAQQFAQAAAAQPSAQAGQASQAPASPQASQAPQAPPPAGSPTAPASPASPPGAAPAPGTPAKPWVPVAASTLAAHPDAYYGENVSMTGTVEQLLSKFAFSVDQGKARSGGKEVLVVAPTLQMPVDASTYVTVLGEVVKFDPAEIGKKAKDYKNDLQPEVAAKYQGQPAIIATSVINAAGLDIAKRLPPPMTGEEQEFQKIMRQVGPANAALRGAMDKLDANATKEQAAVLTKALSQAESFWRVRGNPDAIKWAADARAMAESIDKAIGAGKWDEAKASSGTLGQQCQSCHGAYRERFDDGSFRIKPGSR